MHLAQTKRESPRPDTLFEMQLRYPMFVLSLVSVAAGWRVHTAQQSNAVPSPLNVDVVTENAPVEDLAEERTLRFTEHSMQIAGSARQLLKSPDRNYRNDCSGYISSVYTHAGIDMDGTVAQIYAHAEAAGLIHHNPIPHIGDLVFFDNTHDRNNNGTWDDVRTHIAVVIDVEPDGTAVLAHKGSKYALLRMNLLHPMAKKGPEDQEWNGHLRRYGRTDTWSLYLASQLWSGFATVDPDLDWK